MCERFNKDAVLNSLPLKDRTELLNLDHASIARCQILPSSLASLRLAPSMVISCISYHSDGAAHAATRSAIAFAGSVFAFSNAVKA